MRYLLISALLGLISCSAPDVDDATDAVRAELVDGPSAKFRAVQPCPSGQGYYGQVSSIDKNGMRTGFGNFIYQEGEAALAGVGDEYVDLRANCARRARNS
ncbi:hypothetical protein [Sphingomonas sp. OK281]|uniref:hypothetical protein n=1 Tax=Sphingomonas sp. OK281 TaxID=1881067 RepID=UPI0008ED779B|nr:hypothetical protein [Sphingomonas sp. OK281]SFN72179.1 hypothetical protein SAMN05428984_0382 [Sphingomonas sp. OK281]